MRVFEIVMALVFGALGLRSAWYWISRPFESTRIGDHLLYALFVTGRVGLWLSVAGAFAIFLSIDTQGRAYIEDAARFRWYAMVPGVLAFLQLLSTVLLAGRAPALRRDRTE
jgi:hypothetical protein